VTRNVVATYVPATDGCVGPSLPHATLAEARSTLDAASRETRRIDRSGFIAA